MESTKSLSEVTLIATLLRDVHTLHGDVFNARALKLTLRKVESRARSEGISFLTKTLPRLGKALDKALSEECALNSAKLGFKPQLGSQLPMFMGEFFNRVLHPDGTVLQDPCVPSIKVLRDVLYIMYKYELPYSDKQEQQVLFKFKKTEEELESVTCGIRFIDRCTKDRYRVGYRRYQAADTPALARRAKLLLTRLFSSFDANDIVPRHGPGAVATRQRLWDKYRWTNICSRITDVYPIDAYFHASMGHVCDSYKSLCEIDTKDLPARVVLVPKDSRGPRLISCEPVDFQWIQQGLGRAIMDHVEQHRLTRYSVHFTDQTSNQIGALWGSKSGRYATLDLNEASDRVSLDLVRLLFPEHICAYLEACRSLSTVLPNGEELKLNKFAPMGSALCFPILALTVWAILCAGAPDADTVDGVLVYGDDVVVPTAYAENAIKHLESFGLKVNRDKSCTKGFFRESCGVDAYKGVDVTPLRIRTVWSSLRSPSVYTSWIAYANAAYERRYYHVYDYIVQRLCAIYGQIPESEYPRHEEYPSLYEVPDSCRPQRTRINRCLQRREWYVWTVGSPTINHSMPGWLRLLRYFTEGSKAHRTLKRLKLELKGHPCPFRVSDENQTPFQTSSYTKRDASMLVKRWRRGYMV